MAIIFEIAIAYSFKSITFLLTTTFYNLYLIFCQSLELIYKAVDFGF